MTWLLIWFVLALMGFAVINQQYKGGGSLKLPPGSRENNPFNTEEWTPPEGYFKRNGSMKFPHGSSDKNPFLN